MEKNRAAEREEKRGYWREHLDAWRASEVAQATYCREKNLPVHRFLYWKKKLLPATPSTSFVEIPIAREFAPPLFRASPVLSLVIGDRYRIEIPRGFDPETLAEVARIVSGL